MYIIITNGDCDVDGGSLAADSQPKWHDCVCTYGWRHGVVVAAFVA